MRTLVIAFTLAALALGAGGCVLVPVPRPHRRAAVVVPAPVVVVRPAVVVPPHRIYVP